MVVGQTFGHYTILDKLGEGGMGEVYLAEDTTLKRQVALKVLPPHLAASQERLDRFQREAETLAALDHPNIVTIHSVEEVDGVRFLTMQLVEGKRLSDLIPKSGMALERIFEIAIPLADALAGAHEKGVIHRDLKPGNIMVTDEGRVKVLDFGLAKLRPELDAGEATSLPTEPLTDEGRILGTVPYMSPEQLEGRELDARTDVFSLGVILYEMATGERPFKGDSSVSIISSIIRDTPREIDTLRPELPHHLARIIRHCLEKETRRRYQSALDVRNELEDLRTESASGEVWRMRAPPQSHRRAMLWGGLAATVVLLLAALAVAIWILRAGRGPADDGPAPGTGTFTKLTFDISVKGRVSASPDGRFFAYASDASGNWDIYLQRIAGGKAINLTEDSADDDRQPAFSPDGESIAFRSERDGGGIYIMGATGESVRRVTDRGFFPDWSPDGKKIVFSTIGGRGRGVGNADARIWTIDLSTEESTMILDRSALMPAWSPDGRRIAYYGYWTPADTEAHHDLFTALVDGGEPVAVTSDIHFEDSPAWSPDSRSLYFVSDRKGSRDLWRVRIDQRAGKKLGQAESLTSGIRVRHLALAGDGHRILYSSAADTYGILRVPFDPVAERVVGPAVAITEPGLQATNPWVSPDGEWIAFDAEFGQPGSRAIGVIRADGTGVRQVTDSGYRDRYPRWSPDGQRLAFYSTRSGTSQAWVINTDGSGLRQLTDNPDEEVLPPVWAPDGSRLAAGTVRGERTYVFHPDRTWSEEAPTKLPPIGDGDDRFVPDSWSPDGKTIVGEYWRNEVSGSSRLALYSLDLEEYTVTALELGGAAAVRWMNDGRRVFCNSSSGKAGAVYSIYDTESGEHHEVLSGEVLSIAPDILHRFAALSPDNQTIYFCRRHIESAIWMLTFDQQP